jgi:hypothetical protein
LRGCLLVRTPGERSLFKRLLNSRALLWSLSPSVLGRAPPERHSVTFCLRTFCPRTATF